MTAPCTVVETGPETIRRLWPDTTGSASVDAATVDTALDGLDDPIALVDGRPIGIEALWRTVLHSLCDSQERLHRGRLIIIYPSWWPAARVERVTAAAQTVAGEVATYQRAWLLGTAAPGAVVVVEIAARLVAITGTVVAAEPRTGTPHRVADAVARRVGAMATEPGTAVVVDGPDTVGGAGVLAAMIAGRLDSTTELTVQHLDQARLGRLVTAAFAAGQPPAATDVAPAAGPARRRRGRTQKIAAAAAVSAAALSGLGTCDRENVPAGAITATAFLVEGRVTLQVPRHWPAQRITGGPGSARVTLTSPSDPRVALHLTQSPVADETLDTTAEFLARAIAAEPAGVFVDFEPAGHRAGRAAVMYRELRVGREIGWAILLDDGVRISIGCQSPPGSADAVRDACDQAVQTAHRLR